MPMAQILAIQPDVVIVLRSGNGLDKTCSPPPDPLDHGFVSLPTNCWQKE